MTKNDVNQIFDRQVSSIKLDEAAILAKLKHQDTALINAVKTSFANALIYVEELRDIIKAKV